MCVYVCVCARACRPHSLPCDCSSARSHSLSLSSGSSIISVSPFLSPYHPRGGWAFWLADFRTGGQVGFTRLSTTMSALRAVRLLNDVFSRVEAAAARLGSVWKVRRPALSLGKGGGILCCCAPVAAAAPPPLDSASVISGWSTKSAVHICS